MHLSIVLIVIQFKSKCNDYKISQSELELNADGLCISIQFNYKIF